MASPPHIPLHDRPVSMSTTSTARRLSDQRASPPPPGSPDSDAAVTCTDRAELIERLKRGESPTWMPNRHHVSSRAPSSPRSSSRLIEQQYGSIWNPSPVTPSKSNTLLSPPTITPERRQDDDASTDDESRLHEGLGIERPRSALHSGDFTQDEAAPGICEGNHGRRREQGQAARQGWMATSPPYPFARPPRAPARPEGREPEPEPRATPSSLSSSLSMSFIYKPPTSPLVQSESNDDLNLPSPMEGIDIASAGVSRTARRHTLMASHSGMYGLPSPSHTARHPPSMRQERSYPYQAHQPRRSLNSTPNFPLAGTSPQTPALDLRPRRPSYSSDSSPIQHASMVGSYEESILRGRMSTTPSKPLDFLAQIGVLGLGKCKSSLRCPPHVTLPFPAVFYSYATSSHGRSKDEDGPSPYVGQIDLENGLPNQEDEARSKRKAQSRTQERRVAESDVADAQERPDRETRRLQRPKRRSGSPRAPLGGSYRIPEKGQIQIILKNPNKTAVKLFLVPYDLAGMEPGTKTFIRQRSYSAGPIIDSLPEAEGVGNTERPILRYLVHLHISCPSKGRFFLYKSIRVVFANRVPDGKERLRNEITLPEPRYTAYKPIRVMHPPISAGTGPGASLAAEKAFRRRSSGFFLGASSSQALDAVDGFAGDPATPHRDYSSSHYAGNRHAPVQPIPLRFPVSPMQGVSASSQSGGGSSYQTSHASSRAATALGAATIESPATQRYDKLNKGDVGYGGNAFSGLINGSPGLAEGLLSQRLRSLGVEARAMQQQQQQQQDPNAPPA